MSDYEGFSSGKEEKKEVEEGGRAGLRRDVFQKETFLDRIIEMGMRIVGLVFHHPIVGLSLLILNLLPGTPISTGYWVRRTERPSVRSGT